MLFLPPSPDQFLMQGGCGAFWSRVARPDWKLHFLYVGAFVYGWCVQGHVYVVNVCVWLWVCIFLSVYVTLRWVLVLSKGGGGLWLVWFLWGGAVSCVYAHYALWGLVSWYVGAWDTWLVVGLGACRPRSSSTGTYCCTASNGGSLLWFPGSGIGIVDGMVALLFILSCRSHWMFWLPRYAAWIGVVALVWWVGLVRCGG